MIVPNKTFLKLIFGKKFYGEIKEHYDEQFKQECFVYIFLKVFLGSSANARRSTRFVTIFFLMFIFEIMMDLKHFKNVLNLSSLI